MIGRHCRSRPASSGPSCGGRGRDARSGTFVTRSYRLLEKVGLAPSVNELARNLPTGCSGAWRSPGPWPPTPLPAAPGRAGRRDEPQETRALDEAIPPHPRRGGVTVFLIEPT